MKVLILAGGFATRLWPLTEHRSKPLLLLDGKTILAHILGNLSDHLEVIILTNAVFEADFRREILKFPNRKIDVFVEDAFSDGEKVGALRAISLVISHYKISENVLVLAGDNLLPDLRFENLAGDDFGAVIAIQEVLNTYEAKKFGVVELRENDGKSGSLVPIKSFEEKPENPKSNLVSTGFMFLGKHTFSVLRDFAERSPDNLGAIFTEFLEKSIPVFALKVKGDWFDVGSYETYLSAHQKLQKKPVLCGKNVVDSKNQYLGKVYLGDNCQIENCRIIDSIIYPGSCLKNCYIAGSVVDENCYLENLDLSRKLIRKKTKLVGEW